MAFLGAALGGFGGSVVGGAVVQLLLDDKQFQASMAKARGQTQTTATGFSKFAGVAKAGFAAVGFAAVAGLGAAFDAATEAQTAQLKLQNSIENSSKVSAGAEKAFIAQANALRDLTGADDEAILGAQAFLIQMRLTQSQVTSLTPLIVDLSAKLGIDLETAAKAVGKAVNGNIGGLSRLGIVVDKNAASADAYKATLDALSGAQGFAAKQAEAQPWRVLAAQFEELVEKIGEGLIPVVKLLTDVLGPLIDGLGLLFGAFDAVFDVLSNSNLEEFHKELVDAGLATEEATRKIQEMDRTAREAQGGPRFLGRAMNDLREETQEAQAAARRWAGAGEAAQAALDDTRRSTNQARGSIQRFARAGDVAMKDFREAVRGSSNFVMGRWEDLMGQSRVTAGEIIRQFRRGLRAQAEFAENTRTFADKVQDEFGGKVPKAAQEMISDLAQRGDEGAAIMAALADANGSQIRRMLGQWRQGKQGPDLVLDVLKDIDRELTNLANRTVVTIPIRLDVQATGPGASAITDALASELIRGQTG